MDELSEAGVAESNPYQPPSTPPVLSVLSRRFVCPTCDAALPFVRLWLMQPMGRCPYCRTRLVVRRRGWNKVWTPALMFLLFVGAFLLAVVIGLRAIFFVPIMLVILATTDAAIAYRIGYFDRPRWMI